MARDTHEGATTPETEGKMPRSHATPPAREPALTPPTDPMPRSDGTPARMETPMGAPPEDKMPRRM